MYPKLVDQLDEIDLDHAKDAELLHLVDGHRDCPFYREGRTLSVQVLHFELRTVVVCRHCGKELRSEAPGRTLLES